MSETRGDQWRYVQPLTHAQFQTFSASARRFCHDANNALAAGFAAQELAQLTAGDERQAGRLARVGRQLESLRALVRDMQNLAFRAPAPDLSVDAALADGMALAKKLNVALEVGAGVADSLAGLGGPATHYVVNNCIKAACRASPDATLGLSLVATEGTKQCATVELLAVGPVDPQLASEPPGYLGLWDHAMATVLAESNSRLLRNGDWPTLRLRVELAAANPPLS